MIFLQLTESIENRLIGQKRPFIITLSTPLQLLVQVDQLKLPGDTNRHPLNRQERR